MSRSLVSVSVSACEVCVSEIYEISSTGLDAKYVHITLTVKRDNTLVFLSLAHWSSIE